MELIYTLVCIFSVSCENNETSTTERVTSSTQIITAPINVPVPPDNQNMINECHQKDGVFFPTYAPYLIGFFMIVMLIAIIYLATALYLKKTIKMMYDTKDSKQYYRQDSNGPILCQVNNTDNYKSNGSTFTVNSGIIEINRNIDPDTPTRTDSDIKIYYNKPAMTMPLIQRKQMDEIIQQVLNRSKKTASTSMRELNELQNEINVQTKDNANVHTQELNVEQPIEINSVPCDKVKKPDKEIKLRKDEKISNDKTTLKDDTTLNIDEDKLPENEHKSNEIVVEAEVYDTVRTPTIKIDNDSDEPDYNMPLYDCPPIACKVIMIDPDTEYLMPLCRGDKSSYINAHTPN